MERLLANKQIALLVISLQEAFAATVPFFLLTSVVSLLEFIFAYYNLQVFSVNAYRLLELQNVFFRFSSFVATAAIAYFYARRVNTSPVTATILSMATLVAFLGTGSPYPLVELPYGFAPVTLINPLVAVFVFKLLEPWLTLSLPNAGGKQHIYRHISHIFVFLAAFASTVLILKAGDAALGSLVTGPLGRLARTFPATPLLLIRDLLTQLFWFLGIHGGRMANTFIGKEILSYQLFPNLTFAEFNRLFVVIGGAGVGLSLLLALLIAVRDRSLRAIGYISIPLVIFNIDTLLIYTIVVLNRYLFVPFVGLPIFNFLVAYLFLGLSNVRFSDYYIVWNTPVFIDGYLKTDGDLRVAALQVLLVAFDTLVYVYFIRRYTRVQSARNHLHRLESNLGLRGELRSQEGLQAFMAHQRMMEAHAQLDAVIQDLHEENLRVYYQPKLPVSGRGKAGLEALLRHQKDGEIRGPAFLSIIENAGLSHLIDLWVCRKVKRDLAQMGSREEVPQVSINLNPDTFLNDAAVSTIIETLGGENVVFEIVERSFLAGERALRNLRRLKEAGFGISIDDFGVGFSSLETIIHHSFVELKLDRSLIAAIDGERGYLVARGIVDICHQVGSLIVAEGVETDEQLARLCRMGVDYVQGFRLAPALPLYEALAYLSEHAGPVCEA